MNLDLYIFNAVNQYAGECRFLDWLAVFFAGYFQYILVIILLVVVLKNFRKSLPMIISVATAVFLSRIVITEVIRNFFYRFRPFVENQATLLISQSPEESSMPSGHAAFFFALAMAVYFYNKKLGIFLFISAFLISISRVFCGVHWPSDILAGAFVGIFSGWLVYKISQRFLKQKKS